MRDVFCEGGLSSGFLRRSFLREVFRAGGLSLLGRMAFHVGRHGLLHRRSRWTVVFRQGPHYSTDLFVEHRLQSITAVRIA